MKLLKNIFYGICILIVLGCGAVLICALNPSLTQSISAKLNSEEELKSGEIVIEMLPSTWEDEAASTEVGTKQQAIAMVGYEPIIGEVEEVAYEDAKALEDSLEVGESGEKLTFDETMYPYYGMLDKDGQTMYKQIYANALERNASFTPVITFQNSNLKKVFEAVYNDHPELFWLETAYSCKYLQNDNCLEITLKFNETVDDFQNSKEKFEARAKEIIAITDQFAQLEAKEKVVHDELVENVTYQKGAAMGQSAYSALVNGESVCAGYARAFQYIMQQLGVPCYYCTGLSEGDHAWNIIKLGGKYYNVDVTWDDTNPSTYDYYNKTDAEFATTHVRTSLSVKLPACVEAASDAASYVEKVENKPLEWPLKPFDSQEAYEEEQRKKKEENLDKAGITEEEVLDNMTEYYADCLAQMEKAGTGLKTFTNVIPKSLWETVEQAYGQNGHKKGYVEEALKKLKMENFAIQLQVEDLSGGYYKLHHNISTW